MTCIFQMITSNIISQIFQHPAEMGQNDVKTWGLLKMICYFPWEIHYLKGIKKETMSD